MLLVSEEEFEEIKEREKGGCKAIVFWVDEKDRGWIQGLQVRKRDQRLKEDREKARVLIKDEEVEQKEEGTHSGEQPAERARNIDWLDRMGLQ